jgi:ectoine hydroxylase-related dioxygenase (phytanoyl-CoA dioxygenase family)
MISPKSASNSQRLAADVCSAGFSILRCIIPEPARALVEGEVARLDERQLSRRGQMYAARNLLVTASSVRELAASAECRALVEPILGAGAFSVRAMLFDKVPGANWNLGWHQDQIIPVAERRDVDSFSGWSVKKGVSHVRPPAAVLERMLAMRIHIDDCGLSNGALCVIPGSHVRRLMSSEQIHQIVSTEPPVACEARRGDVLVMRPLLLNSTSPATSPRHRRVIHIEFAADPLPGGLEWAKWS